MRLEIQNAGKGTELPATSLKIESGQAAFICADTDQRPTLLGLLATGRIIPSTGEILVDGETSRSGLRKISALVDAPQVCAPPDDMWLAGIVAEELAFAGRWGNLRASLRWLKAHNLRQYAYTSANALAPEVRIQALVELAILREVKLIVLVSPDRHGGNPDQWWPILERVAAQGYAILAVVGEPAARILSARGAICAGNIAVAEKAGASTKRPELVTKNNIAVEKNDLDTQLTNNVWVSSAPENISELKNTSEEIRWRKRRAENQGMVRLVPKFLADYLRGPKMKILQMVFAEFRRLLATPMSRLALLALAIVPLLYGGVYLWANQDPYAKLSSLPVALVVEDEGGQDSQGNYLNVGEQVAKKIVAAKTFDWHLVSAKQAASGVKNEAFDFTMTLPSNFTQDLLSVSTPHPRQAEVLIVTNDANSYLASTIGQQAAKQIKASITQLVNENAAYRFIQALSESRDGFVKAHDGAAQLHAGSLQAANGGQAIHTGLAQIEAKTQELPDKTALLASGAQNAAQGAKRLYDGLAQADSGAIELDAGAGKLAQGTKDLENGAKKIAAGAQKVAAGNQKIAEVGHEVENGVDDGLDLINQLGEDILADLQQYNLPPQVLERVQTLHQRQLARAEEVRSKVAEKISQLDQLADGAGQVSEGAEKLARGAEQLSKGSADLHTGTGKIVDATHKLTAGGKELAAGNDKLAAGSELLASSSKPLSEAISKAASGSAQLDAGIDKLADGTNTLKSKLAEPLDLIPNLNDKEQQDQAQGISNPVNMNFQTVASAGSYGAGLAPFFLSLAAWIGMYALMLVMRPVSKRAITALRWPFQVGVAGWLSPTLMGVLQALALYGVVTFALDFKVVHPMLTPIFMILTCATFAAIIVALNVWLGPVGQFLGLVFMVLQLVTAGGTFPWQTLPGLLKVLHHWLPMSYSVDGLRHLMYGGQIVTAGHDALFLLAVLLIAISFIVIGVARQQNHRTLRDLRPSLLG